MNRIIYLVLFSNKKELEILSDTITDWKEGSRYGKGVRTTVQTVHNIYISMNEAFLEIQEKNNQERAD